MVMEMQIELNSYYLEMVMNQGLVNNFAINCNKPKVNTIEQDTPPENEPNDKIHVLQIGVTTYMSKMILTLRVQIKQNHRLRLTPTNLLLQQVQAYPKIYILTQMPF